MGCTSSAPVPVSPAVKRRPTSNKASEKQAPRKGRTLFVGNPHEAKANDVNRQDLRSLTTDCYTIHRPKFSTPICCLSDVSMPILVSPISLVSGEATDLILPVFGISRLEMGRVICLGDTEILTLLSSDSDNDMMFLENLLRWAGGPSPAVRMGLIYGLDHQISERLSDLMMGFGFGFDILKTGAIEFQKYAMLIVRSDCPVTDGMIDFLTAGGCIICTPAEAGTPHRFRFNRVIGEAGIGFAEGPFLAVDNGEEDFKFDLGVTDLQHYRLPNLTKGFVDIMNSEDVRPETLDKMVTYLIYHVRLLAYRGQSTELYDLCAVAMRYLVSNNYIEKNVICSEYQEALLGALVSEALKKLLAEELVFDLSMPFPGRCQQVVDMKELVLTCPYAGMYSTGLYLRPNMLSVVSIAREIKSLKVRIGSHHEDLSRKPFPWKRFPNVVMEFDVHQGDTQIASPFGGLVYFIIDQPSQDEVLKFQVTISNIAKGPCYTFRNKKKWGTRKDADVPITEFIGKKVIFTLPTTYARDMPAVEQSMTAMDEIIDALDNTSAAKHARPYRVVFDVELVDGKPICGYPCVFDYTWIDVVFNLDAPSSRLFNFLAILALSSMPSHMFSPLIGPMIAMVCAWNVFRHRWPNEPVASYFDYAATDIISLIIKNVKTSGIDSFTSALTQVRENSAADTIPLESNEATFCNLLMPDKEQAAELLSLIHQVDDQHSSALIL